MGTYRTPETTTDSTLQLVQYNTLKRYASASQTEIALNTGPMKEIDDSPEKSSSSSLAPYFQSEDGGYRTPETNTQSEETYSALEVVPYSALEVVPYSALEVVPYSALGMVPYNAQCYRSALEMQWPRSYNASVLPTKGEQAAPATPAVPSGAVSATAEPTLSAIYSFRNKTFWIAFAVLATLIIIRAVIRGFVGGGIHKTLPFSNSIIPASTENLLLSSNLASATGKYSFDATSTPFSIPNLTSKSTTPTLMTTSSTSTTETSASTSPSRIITTPTSSIITSSISTAKEHPTTSTTSTTTAAIPQSTVCVGGSGPGNYAGLCSFSCHYGYCPSGPCTCTVLGSPVPTPTITGIIGVSLTDEDASYLGLCSFCCNHGYCPATACTTG